MKTLKGIIPPLVTPLLDSETLDIGSLQILLDHVIDGHAEGIFILGTTGEGPSLTHSLRKKIVTSTCAFVDQKVPVLVGITDTSLTESITLAMVAADSGAEAVVLSAPYYFPISQTDLIAYAKKVISASPLPVYLYNMPNCTKTSFEIDTVKILSDLKNVAGIKDSSGDLIYFKNLIQLKHRRPDWSVLIGPELLLADAIIAGGDGGVCGGANLFPHLYTNLYRAALKRDTTQMQLLQIYIMDIAEQIYKPDYLPGLKFALSCKQLCREILADPLRPAKSEQKDKIRNCLGKIEAVLPRPSDTVPTKLPIREVPAQMVSSILHGKQRSN